MLPGTALEKRDFEKLARCGISCELAVQALLRRVTSEEGGAIVGRNGSGDYAGVLFPYVWPGEAAPREYRLRRDRPELEYDAAGQPKERGKYLSPPGRGNLLYAVPGTDPAWLQDPSLPAVITEGEKKTLALWALAWHKLSDASDRPRFVPFGLPGVWNWRGTTGKAAGPDGSRRDVKGLIPDFSRCNWRGRKVTIAFDVNLAVNESVQAARAGLTRELRNRGAKVAYMDWPTGIPAEVNGIDDYVGVAGPDAALALIEAAPMAGQRRPKAEQATPQIINCHELSRMELQKATFLVENTITGPGAWSLIGGHKTGKTLFAAQLALSYQAGVPFLDYYRTLESRGVLFVEQDDCAGLSTLQEILAHSKIRKDPKKFFTVSNAAFTIGPGLVTFLEKEIRARDLGLIVLDSYTAMRSARGSGVDVVKAEAMDFGILDGLAKREGCVILILHHRSRGNASLDWSEQAAGTFAIGAATEGEIHISRFRDLASTADERLIRIRGRRFAGLEAVIRFRRETLDYEHVIEGGAAELYPDLIQIRNAFGKQTFSPKSLSHETGMARASAFRLIGRLAAAGVIERRGYGEYALAEGL